MPELPAEARVELARRWLAAFGPATAADLKWWTGWTVAQVKQALAAIGPVEVDLDGTTGLVLPDDEDRCAAPEPWVALLPALDPTPMGWSERSWYLGDARPGAVRPVRQHRPDRVVRRPDRRRLGAARRRQVVHRLLEDVGAEAATAVDEAAGRLAEWIGPVRVLPRFRTPLERELAG